MTSIPILSSGGGDWGQGYIDSCTNIRIDLDVKLLLTVKSVNTDGLNRFNLFILLSF